MAKAIDLTTIRAEQEKIDSSITNLLIRRAALDDSYDQLVETTFERITGAVKALMGTGKTRRVK